MTKNGCPPLEDLAAFLDGRLSGEERARMTAHLADCERCYEVFAGATRFQEDSAPRGRVFLFPFRKRKPADPGKTADRDRWKTAALAASALLVVGLGSFIVYQAFLAQPEMVVADLIEPLQGQEAARNLYQYDVHRGPGDEEGSFSDRPSFMVGVFLVDLRLSLKAGDVEPLDGLLHEIASELEAVGYMDEEVAHYRALRDQIRDKSRSAALLRQLQAEALEMEAKLSGDESMLRPEALAFGKWTEAARLAAVTRTPDFFEKRANRRFLDREIEEKEKAKKERDASTPHDQGGSLGSELELDLEWEMGWDEDEVLNLLHKVRGLWKDENLTEEDYTALAETLEQIIDRYDRSSA
ncbi:MAG TPA: zf-HC2 domain-containing protein [Thermoanaerobaculia bacterium]